MIYDTIDHAGLYRPISANLAKALDFLTSTDLSKYDTERVEIDGERCMPCSSVTRPNP